MSRSRTRELSGLAAVAVAVCCGVPLVLGAAALGTAAGIALGSSLVVAIGLAMAALGVLRWHRRRSCLPHRLDDRLSSKSSGAC